MMRRSVYTSIKPAPKIVQINRAIKDYYQIVYLSSLILSVLCAMTYISGGNFSSCEDIYFTENIGRLVTVFPIYLFITFIFFYLPLFITFLVRDRVRLKYADADDRATHNRTLILIVFFNSTVFLSIYTLNYLLALYHLEHPVMAAVLITAVGYFLIFSFFIRMSFKTGLLFLIFYLYMFVASYCRFKYHILVYENTWMIYLCYPVFTTIPLLLIIFKFKKSRVSKADKIVFILMLMFYVMPTTTISAPFAFKADSLLFKYARIGNFALQVDYNKLSDELKAGYKPVNQVYEGNIGVSRTGIYVYYVSGSYYYVTDYKTSVILHSKDLNNDTIILYKLAKSDLSLHDRIPLKS